MKKYLATALFSMSCFCVDAAEAAKLSFVNNTSNTSTGVGMVNDVGFKVTTALQGLSGWAWSLSNLTKPSHNTLLGYTKHTSKRGEFNTYFSEDSMDSMVTRTYFLSIATPPEDINDSFADVSQDASNSNDVPLPAAIWLFGSAVFGIHGLVRRKTRIVFTA